MREVTTEASWRALLAWHLVLTLCVLLGGVLLHPPAVIEVGAKPSIELVRDGCGRGWHQGAGVTNGAIGAGANLSRMGVPTTPGAQAGTIPNQIGAAPMGLG